MQIRCTTCTKTIAIAPTGALPPACPHCDRSPVPEQLGAYKLDRLLATGGMGEVYLAHHTELGTEVAIKLLPALPLDAIAAVRERFAREARLTAKVEHRGVVRVISSDAHGDRPYLVLELVTGSTLRQLAKGGPMPPVQAARIVAEAADVLAAAHAQGVLHRDIKPDNVMVEPDGTVRVLDFGIARAIADDAPLTRTGEIVGTPEYMAPEQLLDGPEATDARTDVHALGVMLYELLTGKSPYRSANVFQSLKLVESLVPQTPSGEDLPAGLAQVAMRALEKRAEDRFAAASDLAAAIRTAVPAVQEAAPQPRASKWPLQLAMAGFVLGAAALGFVIWFVEGIRGPLPEEETGFPILATSEDDLERSDEDLRQLLQRGSWYEALVRAEEALVDGDEDAREMAQLAFVLSHAAWLVIADAPAWLAAYDMQRRERLFGDLLEPGEGHNEQLRNMLLGDQAAWLQYAASADAPPLLAILDGWHAGTTLRMRLEKLQELAQRLPIEEPEHWLVRTIERDLRSDREGSLQAAEMAWLHGAGELAILLHGALTLMSREGPALERIWQRVARSDKEDCPASTLLLLYLEARGIGHVRFEPSAAHAFPIVHQESARHWFLWRAGKATEPLRYNLLCVAAALRAKPDFDKQPWSLVAPNRHKHLEQEYERAK